LTYPGFYSIIKPLKIMKKFLYFFIPIIVLDQLTKLLVRTKMYIGETIPAVPLINISYTDNTGIAFGMFRNSAYSNIFFSITTVIILLSIIYLFYYKKNLSIHKHMYVPVNLIITGATGNLIDRIFVGKVTDFIDIYAGSYHWPAFNVADSSISIGGTILAIYLLCYRN